MSWKVFLLTQFSRSLCRTGDVSSLKWSHLGVTFLCGKFSNYKLNIPKKCYLFLLEWALKFPHLSMLDSFEHICSYYYLIFLVSVKSVGFATFLIFNIGNLCLLFFPISLATGLSTLLIFSTNHLLVSFFCVFPPIYFTNLHFNFFFFYFLDSHLLFPSSLLRRLNQSHCFEIFFFSFLIWVFNTIKISSKYWVSTIKQNFHFHSGEYLLFSFWQEKLTKFNTYVSMRTLHRWESQRLHIKERFLISFLNIIWFHLFGSVLFTFQIFPVTCYWFLL